MEKGQKRTRADRISTWRKAEEERQRRDAKRYEAWCAKRDAGERLDISPIPTCCPCFDNCGESTATLEDYGRQHKISIHALEEEFAHLFPSGLDQEELKKIREDPVWYLTTQEASTPNSSMLLRHSEPLEAMEEVRTGVENLSLMDSSSPHQLRRKTKHPTVHHQQEAVAQHSPLDLNTTTKEDCITTCQQQLAFSFYHQDDHSLYFTPVIIGQKKQGQVDGEPKEYYHVHYLPEGFLPDQWLPEEEATKPVEKKLEDLGYWAFNKFLALGKS